MNKIDRILHFGDATAEGGMNMPCIMPEMPYCPACKFGRVVYPADVETFYDTYGGECEWVCTCKDEDAKEDAQ